MKIKDLTYETDGKIEAFEIKTTENKLFKKFIPSLNSKISLKNTDIKFKKNKLNQTAELKGTIKLNEKYENFDFKNNYNFTKKDFEILGNINLKESFINIPNLVESSNNSLQNEKS